VLTRLLVALLLSAGFCFVDASSGDDANAAARIRMLIRQIDSEMLAERESAALELIAIGTGALPELEKELASKPSLEMRCRLENLIEEIYVQLASPLIALLDADEFAVRQKAHEDLEQMGDQARPALQKTLLKSPTLEVQRRVETLLRQIEMQPKKPRK
jgi:hypothetical protein